MLDELKIPFNGSVKLFCYYKATINIAHNLVQHEKPKHVEVNRHFIKGKIEEKIICITYVNHSTSYQCVY